MDNPTKFPDPSEIKQIEEPIIDATVITREEYLGGILKLLEEKRGAQKKFEYIGGGRVMLHLRNAAERNRARFLRPAEIRPRAATLRSIITSRDIAFRPWCGWTCWWRASRWTRSP